MLVLSVNILIHTAGNYDEGNRIHYPNQRETDAKFISRTSVNDEPSPSPHPSRDWSYMGPSESHGDGQVAATCEWRETLNRLGDLKGNISFTYRVIGSYRGVDTIIKPPQHELLRISPLKESASKRKLSRKSTRKTRRRRPFSEINLDFFFFLGARLHRFASLRSSDPMLFPPFLYNVVSFLVLGRLVC